VYVARVLADSLPHRLEKGDDVVVRLTLELLHALDVERRVLLYARRGVRRYLTELGPGFDGLDLDLDPERELVLLVPDRRHFRQ